MKIVRYQSNGEGPKYGWMLDDKVGEIQGNIFGEYRRRAGNPPVGEVKLLAP